MNYDKKTKKELSLAINSHAPPLSRIAATLPPALFIVINLFLSLPYTIYRGNIDEFTLPFTSLITILALPAVALLLLLIAVSIALRGRALRIYLSTIFIIGVLLWLEGGIIVWDYGVLSGVMIDWSGYRWRAVTDTAIWIVLFGAGVIFYGQVSRKAALASSTLIALQLAFIIFTSLEDPTVWLEKETRREESGARENIFAFSKDQNIIHVILDQFQSDIFEAIIDEDPGRYREAFKGFTFFGNTTASFPTTSLSIPAIISGRTYKIEEPFRDFIKNVMRGKNIFSVLSDAGYEVDRVHSTGAYKKANYDTNYYRIPFPYGLPERQYKIANSTLILDLVLFRAAPHLLKRGVYNDQTFLVQRFLSAGFGLSEYTKEDMKIFRNFASRAFLQDLTDSMTVSREGPLYKFVHLLESHGPLIYNKECRYAGSILESNFDNYLNQQRCALNNFVEFLERLKELGIYDSSFIIVNSDHGTEVGTRDKKERSFHTIKLSPVMAMMAVKPPGSSGPLKSTPAMVELIDIPATISSFIGREGEFGGRPVLSVDPGEKRTRRYHIYTYIKGEKYFRRIDEFINTGRIQDNASWSVGSIYLPPGVSLTASKIDFGTDQAEYFLRSGWAERIKGTDTGRTFLLNYLSTTSIFLTLPADYPVLLSTHVGLDDSTPPLSMTVRVDGKVVGAARLQRRGVLEESSFRIEPDRDRGRISVVEFDFSELARSGARIAPRAIGFESITVKAMEEIKR